jgi:hypothetical protein
VLLFIDEANALPPGNLESLRLLTNMQDDHKNLFTIVLAGQIEFARRLEHPRRANIFQRIGTYCRIDKIQSPDLVKDYVETRLRLAGSSRNVFTDDAIDILWEYSDHGVPRLINKICKLCLKAGETNGFELIDGATARQVAERFQKLTGPALQKRRPRKRTGNNGVEKTANVEKPEAEQPPHRLVLEEEVLSPSEEPTDQEPMESEAATDEAEAASAEVAPETAHETPATEIYEEAIVGKFKIKIVIPAQLLKMAVSSTRDNRVKLAGMLAAQTLDKYPQLTSETATDPVALWSEIKTLILNALEREAGQAVEPMASEQPAVSGEPETAVTGDR